MIVRVRALDAPSIEAMRPRLCELLIDSVRHGASVGFLEPLAVPDAEAYWRGVGEAVACHGCLLLVAEGSGGVVTGTVQLGLDTLPNQRHRGSVSKLLVHSEARRRGIGGTLMAAVERAALDAGRWLLTLDTATAEADRLYVRLGWISAGVIPDYAQNPDGSFTNTALYWKRLPPHA